MLSFVATPRTADDERALAILHRLSAARLSVSEAIDALFDLSAEPSLDGKIAAEAAHLAAEATTDGDLELAEQLLLELLRANDGEVISATGARNQHMVVRPEPEHPATVPPVVSERSKTITLEVSVPS